MRIADHVTPIARGVDRVTPGDGSPLYVRYSGNDGRVEVEAVSKKMRATASSVDGIIECLDMFVGCTLAAKAWQAERSSDAEPTGPVPHLESQASDVFQ